MRAPYPPLPSVQAGEMSEGYLLHTNNTVGLIEAMMDVLCGDAQISLEGDLSPAARAIEAIPGRRDEPMEVLRRNVHWPRQDFVILPLEWDTNQPIKETVVNRLRIGEGVLHIAIAKAGALQFGAYRLDNWTPAVSALFVAGDAVPESALKQMVSRRLLRGYERTCWSLD